MENSHDSLPKDPVMKVRFNGVSSNHGLVHGQVYTLHDQGCSGFIVSDQEGEVFVADPCLFDFVEEEPER